MYIYNGIHTHACVRIFFLTHTSWGDIAEIHVTHPLNIHEEEESAIMRSSKLGQTILLITNCLVKIAWIMHETLSTSC
jgi:hypothetical protein